MRGCIVWSMAGTMSKAGCTRHSHGEDMKAGGGYAPKPLLPRTAKQRPGCTRSTQCPDLAKPCIFSSADHDVGGSRRPANKVHESGASGNAGPVLTICIS